MAPVAALIIAGPQRGELLTVRRSPVEVQTRERPADRDEVVIIRTQFWYVRELGVGSRRFRVLCPDGDVPWEDHYAEALLALIDADPDTVQRVEVPTGD